MPLNTGKLEDLSRKLQAGFVQNSEAKHFLPDSTLRKILRDSDCYLERCLQEAKIDEYEWEEVLSAIRNGGQKLFVILVLMQNHPIKLMIDFVRQDQLLHSRMDEKLPFSHDTLNDILQDSYLVNQFERHQWEVLSPLFKADRTHRDLRSGTILPFIKETPIADGRGGFGIVSRVTLHAGHHLFDLNHKVVGEVEVARKQILWSESSADKFEKEMRIMRMLRMIRHENMTQLLASYSVLGVDNTPTHFLLMPLADMKLTSILRPTDPACVPTLESIFGDEQGLLREMHGLSSALENLHFFEYKERDLRMKGCHFDLDPRNILIHKGKLLLADFGLSRLKHESSDSRTPFHGGGASHYTAPECVGTDDPQYYGGLSDIWSWGGIICDLTVYMMGRATLVNEFQTFRKRTSGGITSSRFFVDSSLNSAVEEWFKKHKRRMSRHHQALIELTKQMLVMQPRRRLDARTSTSKLFMIAAETDFRLSTKSLKDLKHISRLPQFHLVQAKLNKWADYAGLDGLERSLSSHVTCWLERERESHHSAKVYLIDLRESVEALRGDQDFPRLKVDTSSPLQLICKKLWQLAPQEVQDMMEREIEVEILHQDGFALTKATRDTKHLDSSIQIYHDNKQVPQITPVSSQDQQNGDTQNCGNSLVQLLNIRRCGHRAAKNENLSNEDVKGFHVNEIVIETTLHRYGVRRAILPELWTIVSLPDVRAKLVCEWLRYDRSKEAIEPLDLHRRVCSLVRQLSIVNSSSTIGTLACYGYVLDPDNSAIGLLFSLPNTNSTKVMPMTLYRLLESSTRPTLTETFRLAKAVARSMFNFHGIRWFHKDLSSHNVWFCNQKLWRLQDMTKPQPPKSERYASGSYAREPTATPALFAEPVVFHDTARENITRRKDRTTKDAGGERTRSGRNDKMYLRRKKPSDENGTKQRPVVIRVNNGSRRKSQVSPTKDSFHEPFKVYEDMEIHQEPLEGEQEEEEPRYDIDTVPQHYILGFAQAQAEEKFPMVRDIASPPRYQDTFREPENHQVSGDSFRASHDYRDLGIILLEIGFWMPIDRILALEGNTSRMSSDALRQLIIHHSLPRLAKMMGERYKEAVGICLSDEFLDKEGRNLEQAFNKEVLGRLEGCNV